jgi:hypothetical protein
VTAPELYNLRDHDKTTGVQTYLSGAWFLRFPLTVLILVSSYPLQGLAAGEVLWFSISMNHRG